MASEGACAHLHDGLGRAARGADAHADVRGGGGGDVERHGRREVGAKSIGKPAGEWRKICLLAEIAWQREIKFSAARLMSRQSEKSEIREIWVASLKANGETPWKFSLTGDGRRARA